MVLGALDGVEEAVPVVGDALQHVVDPAGSNGGVREYCVQAERRDKERALMEPAGPVRLPGVLDEQDL